MAPTLSAKSILGANVMDRSYRIDNGLSWTDISLKQTQFHLKCFYYGIDMVSGWYMADRRSISCIKSFSHHEVTIPNPVFAAVESWGVTDWNQSTCIGNRNVPDNSPEQEAAIGHSIPRRLDSPTSQATQLPKLELTLTPATGHELSHEINNHSVPTLISQAPGPSQKRSRSPSSPFYPDVTTFSDGKPASETLELNPEDVTARLEDIEVEIDTLHADTEDKELLISELQDSLAAAENEISLL
ncbi:hypothetical protein Tco_0204406 [Tanacetum coccineum]